MQSVNYITNAVAVCQTTVTIFHFVDFLFFNKFITRQYINIIVWECNATIGKNASQVITFHRALINL